MATEPGVDQRRIEVNQPSPCDGIRPIVQPLSKVADVSAIEPPHHLSIAPEGTGTWTS